MTGHAKEFPNLKFVVQDCQPAVEAGVEALGGSCNHSCVSWQ